MESIKGLKLSCSAINPPSVDWFPTKESDLDFIGKILQKPGDGLGQDHPGFNDTNYKKRRNQIGDLTKNYSMKDPIPYIEYNAQETELWTYIYNKVRPLHSKYGCIEYLKAMKDFEDQGHFTPDRVP